MLSWKVCGGCEVHDSARNFAKWLGTRVFWSRNPRNVVEAEDAKGKGNYRPVAEAVCAPYGTGIFFVLQATRKTSPIRNRGHVYLPHVFNAKCSSDFSRIKIEISQRETLLLFFLINWNINNFSCLRFEWRNLSIAFLISMILDI